MFEGNELIKEFERLMKKGEREQQIIKNKNTKQLLSILNKEKNKGRRFRIMIELEERFPNICFLEMHCLE